MGFDTIEINLVIIINDSKYKLTILFCPEQIYWEWSSYGYSSPLPPMHDHNKLSIYCTLSLGVTLLTQPLPTPTVRIILSQHLKKWKYLTYHTS